MYAPPNPIEVADQAARDLVAAAQRAATTATGTTIPAHQFEQTQGGAPGVTCKAQVAGRMCTRGRSHPCHQDTELNRCDICTKNRGSWIDCTCASRCKSPCCRYEVEDHFDYSTIPVPQFVKEPL